MKKFKKQSILFIMTILLLMNFITNIFAKEQVIAEVETLSEQSAYVKLKYFDGKNKNPIRILSWTLTDNNTLKITYETSLTTPNGWDYRKIEGKNYKFPMKIILEEQGKDNITFPDLPKNEEKQLSILNLFYRGIISGYIDGSFKPGNNVNRAEFAKMLTITAKYKISNQNSTVSFKDVKDTFWAKSYIYYLAEKEIFKGRADNSFDPNGNITIGEVLAVINRTFILYNKEKEYTNSLTNHWSNNDFLAMVKAGIVKPTDDFYGSYKPNDKATREQCAILLSRVLEQFYETK